MSTTLDALVAPQRERTLTASLVRLTPWLTAALVLAVGVAIIDPLPVGVVHDDGMYVVLAKALVTGQGYHWIHVPGAPAATHFPPGYPALLALLWLLAPAFPQNVLLFKLANACFIAAGAGVLTVFARERFTMSPPGAAAFAASSMLGIPVLTLSVMVMSEPLFLLLLISILLLAERLVDAPERKRRDIVLLALATGVATLVRTHGIALIAALPIVLVWKRRRFSDAFLFGVVALLVVVPWQLWSSAHSGVVPQPMRGNYESYGAWLASGLRANGLGLLWRTAGRTSIEIIAMFATLTAPGFGAVPRFTALAVLTLLYVLGGRSFAKTAPVSTLFLGLYAMIVILWPFTPARFLWGVWPLVLALPVLGGREVLRWRPAPVTLRVLGRAGAVAVLAVAAGYSLYTARGYRGRWWGSIPRNGAANLFPLVVWAAERTAPTDLLAVEGESAVYLYANRRTVPVHTFTVEQYFRTRTPREEAEIIRAIVGSYHVDAVALTTPTMLAAATLLTSQVPPVLALSDSFPGGLVFKPIYR
ncbi:MAG: hypothetical protein ACJ796_07380 [Gemmatimonadaceae bacterium]